MVNGNHPNDSKKTCKILYVENFLLARNGMMVTMVIIMAAQQKAMVDGKRPSAMVTDLWQRS
jgi:hypothetical protein